MNRLLITAALIVSPMAAMAMPAVGDRVGTDPAQATAALEAAGCIEPNFEAEGGVIEAKCHDANNQRWEIYIDPKAGTVTKVKAND